MKYLEYLAKCHGLSGASARVDADEWTYEGKEKDERELPVLSVFWVEDWNAWIATIDALSSGEYLHPDAAFAWLRKQVDDYKFPVCPHCDDTGIARWYVGDEERSDFCECWHGKRKADAEESLARR